MWSDLTLLLARRGLDDTQAVRGNKDFPINIFMAFPHGTWGQTLVIVLVYHESLSVSYKYLFLNHLVYRTVRSKPGKHYGWSM